MKEIYTKRITRLPDDLPVRSEKGIEVDYTPEGKVSDIYVVDETGRKRIDLDGNVKESYSKTITANGSVTIDSAEYGEEYTSVKEVNVTVECPTIDSAKEVKYTENGEYTISPTEGFSGIASASVEVAVPIESTKTISHNATGTTTVSVPVSANYAGQGNVTVNVTVSPVILTQTEYNALVDAGTVDPNSIYLISNEEAVL